MPDVFVSYSRLDKEFVEKLVSGLAQDGREIWVDWQDIPRAADWRNEIDKGIENSPAFIFVVSKNSLSSEICNHELEYALRFNKRIVPVIRQDIAGDTKAEVESIWKDNTWGKTGASNWTAVSHLNWLFFNIDDEKRFKSEFNALIETLDADLEHIKMHTRILVREREWDDNAFKPGYLLTGEGIPEAENWLAEADNQNKKPQATKYHRNYIARSRAAEDERQGNLHRLESRTTQFRRAAVILGVSIVVAVIAVFFAIQESTQAQNSAATAVIQADVAATSVADANVQLADAEQRVDDANATLAPIPPILTQSANDIASANQLVEDANATLTPIPPTLTQAADDVALANEQLLNAEQQVADANATLAPIPPTLTQAADDIASANQLVSTAESQIIFVEEQLTAVPPTLEALDLQISEAEARVESLNLAAQALELGAAAGERLNEGNSELAALLAIRSLEIAYNPGADNALVSASNRLFTETLITPETGFFSHGSISGNGNLVILGYEDGRVSFWDIKTGKMRDAEDSHRDYVTVSAFTPDSEMAITADDGGDIILWDAISGEALESLNVGAGVTILDVSADGERLAAGLDDGYFCIIEIKDMQEEYCVDTEDTIVYGLAFSPDGDYLTATFSVGADLWELGRNDAEFIGYYGDHRFITLDVAYSPDGDYIVTASDDETMILWDIDTGDEIMRFGANTNRITHVEFTDDGRYLVSASIDGTPRMWDVETGQVLRSFGGHTNGASNISVTDDGRSVLSVSYDNTARIWNSDLSVSQGVFYGHDDWVTDLAFSPDGQYLASASNDSTIRIWEIESNTLFDVLGTDGYLSEGITYLPDGSGILFDFDDKLYQWQIGDDDMREYEDLPAYPDKIRLTGDGEYAVIRTVGEEDDYVGYLNLEEEEFEIVASAFIQDVAVAQNRNIMAWVDDYTSIVLYDIDTDTEITRFDITDFGEGIVVLAISPDADVVMIGSFDGLIAFVDATSGTTLSESREHTTEVSSIVISPDGLFAVSGGLDDRVILWDMQTQSSLRTYNNHTSWVYEAIFSPDGSRIASSGVDRTVQVWFTGLDDLIAGVCTNLSRDFTDAERVRFGITDTEPTCP